MNTQERNFAREERLAVERIRRSWKLGAAAAFIRNGKIIWKRVGPELDDLEAPEFGRRVKEMEAQMRAAGVDPRDSYSNLKGRDRQRRIKFPLRS